MEPLYWFTASVISLAGAAVMTVGFFRMGNDGISKSVTETGITSLHLDVDCDVRLNVDAHADKTTVTLTHVPDSTSVSVENGTLHMTDKRTSSWLHHIQFFNLNLTKSEILITLPPEEYENVQISTGSGDIHISGLQAADMTIAIDAGDLIMEQTCADSLSADIGAGDATCNNVDIVQQSIFELGAGNLITEQMHADRLTVDVGAGDATCSNVDIVQQSIFDLGAGDLMGQNCCFGGEVSISNGAGDVDMQHLTLTADTNISCGGGDVTISMTDEPQGYRFDCSDVLGDVSINGISADYIGNSGSYAVTVTAVGDVQIDLEHTE